MYIPQIYSFLSLQNGWTRLRFLESTFLCVIVLQFFPQTPVALEADFEIFSVLFIKSWIDYAFLIYSGLFMINDTYILKVNWIENLNLVLLPRYCMYWEWTKDSSWKLRRFDRATTITLNDLWKIAKLVISVSGQQILVWGLATWHHNY